MPADHYVMDSDMKKVADAIRTKGGTTDPLQFPDGMVQAIDNIQTGGGGGGVTSVSNSISTDNKLTTTVNGVSSVPVQLPSGGGGITKFTTTLYGPDFSSSRVKEGDYVYMIRAPKPGFFQGVVGFADRSADLFCIIGSAWDSSTTTKNFPMVKLRNKEVLGTLNFNLGKDPNDEELKNLRGGPIQVIRFE